MATLSDLTPDFVFEVADNYNVLVTEFENWKDQTRLKGDRRRKRFNVKCINRNKTTHDYLTGFFFNRRGSYESFTWNNPVDNTDYTVRLVGGSFNTTYKRYGIFDFEFDLIEVI